MFPSVWFQTDDNTLKDAVKKYGDDRKGDKKVIEKFDSNVGAYNHSGILACVLLYILISVLMLFMHKYSCISHCILTDCHLQVNH